MTCTNLEDIMLNELSHTQKSLVQTVLVRYIHMDQSRALGCLESPSGVSVQHRTGVKMMNLCYINFTSIRKCILVTAKSFEKLDEVGEIVNSIMHGTHESLLLGS